MTAEEETLLRIQEALIHLRKGLVSFVEDQMKRRYGADWLHNQNRARRGLDLDQYALLKTMLDNWREVFAEVFDWDQRHKVRNFVSVAYDARNAAAHPWPPINDESALRYLDAMHQLLKMVKAPDIEVAELRRLYDEQRRSGIEVSPTRVSVQPAKFSRTDAVGRARTKRTIEDLLFDYVRLHPDLDDDELSDRLEIRPRQSINQAARRLAAAGRLRRFIGPRGKIISRAHDGKS